MEKDQLSNESELTKESELAKEHSLKKAEAKEPISKSKEQIKLEKLIESLGITTFGYVRREDLEPFGDYYEKRPKDSDSDFEINPGPEKLALEERAFLTFALPYKHGDPKTAGFSIYCQGPDYHGLVDELLAPVLQFLKNHGYEAKLYRDSNALPERLMAARSGLGKLGKNSLLITEKYGSYVFLAEIDTDFPWQGPGPVDLVSPCRDCDLCQRACPSQILWTAYVVTPNCLSALTQTKDLAAKDMARLGGRLFGCDSCQSVCPLNHQVLPGLALFKSYDFMIEPDLEELLALDNQTFQAKYAKTSAGWRGKALLTRNAMFSIHRQGKLLKGLKFASPLVQKAYELITSQKSTR